MQRGSATSPKKAASNRRRTKKAKTNEDSYTRLNGIIKSIRRDNVNREEKVQQALSVIREDPSLATRRFRAGSMTPLRFLVESSASLSVIQSFCNDFPEALASTCDGDAGIEQYPAESACYACNVAASGVIPYLAQHYPLQVEAAGDRLMNTIHFLLRDDGVTMNPRKTFEDIQAMVETAKRGRFLQQSKERQSQILNWAFHLGCRRHETILEYLVDQCPLVTEEFTLRPNFGQHLQSYNLSSPVAKLIPQITGLLDLHVYWKLERESWKQLCQALGRQNSNKLEGLHLKIVEQEPFFPTMHLPSEPEQWVWPYLYKAIGAIPNLQRLVLERKHGLVDVQQGDYTITEAVVALLTRNTIKVLHIHHFHPIQHEEIFAALRENTSLVDLEIHACTNTIEKLQALVDVLTVHNTTLTSVEGIPQLRVFALLKKMVEYRCKLNQLGIAMARDPDTTLSKLIHLVDHAKSDNWGVAISGDTPVGYAYAFLRECPSIWCGLPRAPGLVASSPP